MHLSIRAGPYTTSRLQILPAGQVLLSRHSGGGGAGGLGGTGGLGLGGSGGFGGEGLGGSGGDGGEGLGGCGGEGGNGLHRVLAGAHPEAFGSYS